MLWAGHLAFGYLVSVLCISLFGVDFTQVQVNWLIGIGMLSALLPDLDVLYFYKKFGSLRYQKDVSHRAWISHAPLLYLVAGLGIYFVFQDFLGLIGLVFVLGSFSHFVGDSIEYGVMWLWPFSKKKFRLIEKKDDALYYQRKGNLGRYYWDLFTKVYMKGATFYLEVVLIVLALIVFFS